MDGTVSWIRFGQYHENTKAPPSLENTGGFRGRREYRNVPSREHDVGGVVPGPRHAMSIQDHEDINREE